MNLNLGLLRRLYFEMADSAGRCRECNIPGVVYYKNQQNIEDCPMSPLTEYSTDDDHEYQPKRRRTTQEILEVVMIVMICEMFDDGDIATITPWITEIATTLAEGELLQDPR